MLFLWREYTYVSCVPQTWTSMTCKSFTVSSPDAAQITVGTCFNFVKAIGLKNNDCKDINFSLIHWGRVMQICVCNLTIIGSDNGLFPARRHAIICTYAEILLIGPLWTNVVEILIEIQTFSFTKKRLKVSSAKWRLCCINELTQPTKLYIFF